MKEAKPTPEHIFQLFNAYQTTAALKAAIELDLFTIVGQRKMSVADLAGHCQTSERGIRILCDYLVVSELLEKREGRYYLTPESAAFLNRNSPAYLGTTVRFLNSPYLLDGFKDLTPVVRKGGTIISEEGSLAPEHPMWVEFARCMMPLMAPSAEAIADLLEAQEAGPWRVLDVAAGHGLFGITLAQRNPQAEVFALDWPNVLNVALENAQAAGVSQRFHLLPGSAFEVEWGNDHDIVLLTNFFHHFDPPTCERLMRKVYEGLNPGGLAVTLEFIPNEDRVSPPIPAAFALMMLAGTPAGDVYTFSEYDRMFGSAGFSRNEFHSLETSPQHVIISYKD